MRLEQDVRQRRNLGCNSLLVIVASDVPNYQLLLIFYCEQGRTLAYKNYYTRREDVKTVVFPIENRVEAIAALEAFTPSA